MVAGLRPVLPDRQVLPRRGPAPRPPARVHADRRRDVASSTRTTSSASSRGSSSRVWKEVLGVDLHDALPERALPADAVRGVDGQVRQRQARPALRHAARRPDRRRRRARRRRRPVLEGHRRQVHERRVPARPARPRSSRRCASRRAAQPLARRARQARGVRQGHGRQGPRAREGRRRGQLDAVAARQDDHAGAARRPSTRATGAKDGDLLLFQFGKRGGRPDGDGEPPRPPRARSSGSSRRAGTAGSRTSSGS